MLVKQMLPRAHERLAVIEEEAPVREAAYLMSKPHTDLVVVCRGDMVGVVTKTELSARSVAAPAPAAQPEWKA
jgi:CBS domain-containing protein